MTSKQLTPEQIKKGGYPKPNPETLKRLLDYNPETGRFYWKERGGAEFMGGKRSGQGIANNWNSKLAGKEAFLHSSPAGYKGCSIQGHATLAHRAAWMIYYGETPEVIDHINGIRDDNRIANLRNVSHKINCRNQKIRAVNKSGCVGVRQKKGERKWIAEIKVDYVKKFLGYFDTKQDAIKARKDAEKRYGFHSNHGYTPHPNQRKAR